MAFVIIFLALIVVGPLTFRLVQRQRRGQERSQLAAERGWQFAESDDRLLVRWRGEPFSREGDKRQAFGVISGTVQGTPFTAFDYRRRTLRRLNSTDDYETLTVWALHLPEPLPELNVIRQRAWVRGLVEKLGETPSTPTGHAELDKRYTVTTASPEAVPRLFTPQVTAWLLEQKLDNFRIEGQDLLHWREGLRRAKPQELVATAERLAALAAHLRTAVHQ